MIRKNFYLNYLIKIYNLLYSTMEIEKEKNSKINIYFLPSFFKENQNKEKEHYYDFFINNLKKTIEKKEFHLYFESQREILLKLIEIYKLNNEERAFLISIFLKIIFEERNLTFCQRTTILRDLNSLYSNKKLKNLQINWKVLFNFIEENYFSNESRLSKINFKNSVREFYLITKISIKNQK